MDLASVAQENSMNQTAEKNTNCSRSIGEPSKFSLGRWMDYIELPREAYVAVCVFCFHHTSVHP